MRKLYLVPYHRGKIDFKVQISVVSCYLQTHSIVFFLNEEITLNFSFFLSCLLFFLFFSPQQKHGKDRLTQKRLGE